MELEIKTFTALTNSELYEVLQLRSAVFVVEQQCIYQDMDGKDQMALHLLGKQNGQVVAYLRFFKSGDLFDSATIGRVLVAKSHRKLGYAKILMERAIAYIQSDLKEQRITLSAQTYLLPFYRELGFFDIGDTYLEDGIPHIKMVKE